MNGQNLLLQHDNKPGWKDFPGGKTKNDFKEAMGVYIEALRPGVQLLVHASLNKLLTMESIKPIFKIPDCPGSTGFDAIAGAVNTHSLTIASAEKGFFAQFGAATAGVMAYYGHLVKKIAKRKRPLALLSSGSHGGVGGEG